MIIRVISLTDDGPKDFCFSDLRKTFANLPKKVRLIFCPFYFIEALLLNLEDAFVISLAWFLSSFMFEYSFEPIICPFNIRNWTDITEDLPWLSNSESMLNYKSTFLVILR